MNARVGLTNRFASLPTLRMSAYRGQVYPP